MNIKTLYAAATASAAACGVVLAACAGPRVVVPQQLEPGANEALAMTLSATGEQIYECRAGQGAASHEWVFVAPEALLRDARGNAVGQHGAGPSWQASDGSRIVGTVRQRADAPAPGAVPWLLLAARSSGPDGSFSRVTSIQRVNTVGGVAPASGCAPETAGRTARVGYTADYRFFIPR